MAKEKFNFVSKEQEGPEKQQKESEPPKEKTKDLTDYLEKRQKKFKALEKLIEKETNQEKRKGLEKQKDEIDKQIRGAVKRTMEMMDKIEKEQEEGDFKGTKEEKRAMLKEAFGIKD